MADTSLRNIEAHNTVLMAVVAGYNAVRNDLKNRGALVHLDNNATVDASPAAVDLPTLIVMCNALKAEYNAHIGSTDAHLIADATNVNATAAAVDLATSIALINALKANFNAHLSQATVHINNDAAVIATANGTILSDTITLANAFKAAYNTHIAKAATSTKMVLTGC